MFQVQKVPLFISKLWMMVNDPNTDSSICWSENGSSFVIENQIEFSSDILPQYYKHNNLSSFIRQLNMYGFHKIVSVDNGTMDCGRGKVQFYHPSFQKGEPDLLDEIKRRTVHPRHIQLHTDHNCTNLNQLLKELQQLRDDQMDSDGKLAALKKENAILWQELASLKDKHVKQSNMLNNLVQFLMTLVQKQVAEVKRRLPVKNNQLLNKNDANGLDGLVIEELDVADVDDGDIADEDLLDEDSQTAMDETENKNSAVVSWENATNSTNDFMKLIENPSTNLLSLLINGKDNPLADSIRALINDKNCPKNYKDEDLSSAIIPSTSNMETNFNLNDFRDTYDDASEDFLLNDPMVSGYENNHLGELFEDLVDNNDEPMMS